MTKCGWPTVRRLLQTSRGLAADETGSATLWNLFWLINFLILVGVAIDAGNAWRLRAMLQSTADAAAHAAAVSIIQPGIARGMLDSRPEFASIDGEDPRQVARAVAEINMSPAWRGKMLHGEVLQEEDVHLGRWHPEDRSFDPHSLTPDAVKVTVRRTRSQDNPLPTFLLNLAGFGTWDIEVESMARFYKSNRGACVEPILAAQARVDVQTNDVYVGICVHADADVSVEPSDPWLTAEVIDLVDRVVVSAATSAVPPVLGGLGGSSGLGGLGGSLGLGGVTSLLDQDLSVAGFRSLIAGLRASADVIISDREFSKTELTAGATYYVECSDDQAVPLPEELNLSNIVLISECPVRAAQDLSLKSTVLIANLRALHNPELSLDGILGLPQLNGGVACVPGDGVQILIFVDFDTAARFRIFDPGIYPLGQAVVAAHRDATEVDGEVLASVGVSLVGGLAAGLGLENLTGVCLEADYMLHADAVTLSR